MSGTENYITISSDDESDRAASGDTNDPISISSDEGELSQSRRSLLLDILRRRLRHVKSVSNMNERL